MILTEIDSSSSILAVGGAALRHLTLHPADAGRAPVLVDEAGKVLQPWEVELLRWPPETEVELRCGGYLSDRPPDMELWCNCAD